MEKVWSVASSNPVGSGTPPPREEDRAKRKPVVYTEWSRVTVSELAKIFHLQKAEVYQIIKDQVVLGMMVGSRRKYKIGDFDAALNAKTRNDNAVLLELIQKQQSMAV